jgi:hypothetical protein
MSGLSRRAFCAGLGLAVATLDKYRFRVRRNVAAPRLLAVDVRPATDTKATVSSRETAHLNASTPVPVGLEVGTRLPGGIL